MASGQPPHYPGLHGFPQLIVVHNVIHTKSPHHDALLGGNAQINHLAGLRHVVRQLLVAAAERLAQCTFDALQVVH